ncbi:MAG: hypothetical protein ACRDYB_09685 [Acidimicrobiales bacterium]
MKIHRTYRDSDTLGTEIREHGGGWQPGTFRSAPGYDPPFSGEWGARHARSYGAQPRDQVPPFQPVSVRDVSLPEQHNIGAVHGYARQFMRSTAHEEPARGGVALAHKNGDHPNAWL